MPFANFLSQKQKGKEKKVMGGLQHDLMARKARFHEENSAGRS